MGNKVLTFDEFMEQERNGGEDGAGERETSNGIEAGLPGGPEPKEPKDDKNLDNIEMDDQDSQFGAPKGDVSIENEG